MGYGFSGLNEIKKCLPFGGIHKLRWLTKERGVVQLSKILFLILNIKLGEGWPTILKIMSPLFMDAHFTVCVACVQSYYFFGKSSGGISFEIKFLTFWLLPSHFLHIDTPFRRHFLKLYSFIACCNIIKYRMTSAVYFLKRYSYELFPVRYCIHYD